MSDDPVEPLRKQTRGRFQPGQSGNPRGRKPGTRNRVSILAEKLMTDDAEGVIQAVITAAKAGDMTAARMVLDRIAALPRDRPVRFEAPPIETADDVAGAVQAVLEAVADGCLTPAEGNTVAAIIEQRRKAIETVELERRVTELETRK